MGTKMFGGGYSSKLTSLENSKHTSQRLLWLDILKGIGIILVVFGHVFENDIFYNFVYAFHMPLFFMAAGWLYIEKPFRSYAVHRFYTVMIPYFSFGLLTLIYWQLIERRFRISDMTFLQALIGLIRGEFSCLNFNVHLWFLPCFFLIVVIYNGLRNCIGRKGTYIAVVVLSVVYVLSVYTVALPSLPWGLDRVCQYIAFYALGNWMSENGLDHRVKSKPIWFGIAVALLILVFVLSLLDLTSGVFWFFTGTIGTLAIAIYSIMLSDVRIVKDLLSFLGRISLVVLCIHGSIYRVIIKVLSVIVRMDTEVVRSNILFAAIIVVLALAVSSVAYVIIDKILPWMIGKPMKRKE